MAWYRVVYSDVPITTQWDDGRYDGPDKGRTPTSSISMPTIVFTMLGALDLQHGHKVLEIGTGRGWNTALLSYRAGDKNVTSIEKDGVLVEDARGRLNCSGFSPDLIIGDGERGYGTNSPYDRIIATCSVGAIPSQWIGQAQSGSVIVAPWGPQYGGEAIVRLEIDERGTASGNFVGSSAFMRMSGHRKSFTAPCRRLNVADWPGGAPLTSTSLSPDDVGDWIHMFAIGIQVPDLYCKVEFTVKDSYRFWLADTSTDSWASADYASGLDEYVVAQDGPRRLWDELEAAWRRVGGCLEMVGQPRATGFQPVRNDDHRGRELHDLARLPRQPSADTGWDRTRCSPLGDQAGTSPRVFRSARTAQRSSCGTREKEVTASGATSRSIRKSSPRPTETLAGRSIGASPPTPSKGSRHVESTAARHHAALPAEPGPGPTRRPTAAFNRDASRRTDRVREAMSHRERPQRRALRGWRVTSDGWGMGLVLGFAIWASVMAIPLSLVCDARP
ncbi:rRNA adenine N-6-methyltransferase family protein [Streptomyces sp. DSM 118878]